MPAPTAAEGAKRKRLSNGDKSVKRRRSVGEDEPEQQDPNAKILLMEQGILESKKNYNDITVLLFMMRQFDSGNDESMLATVALCRVFVRLLAQGALTFRTTLSEREGVVVNWLKDQLSQFKAELVQLLCDEDIGVTALTLCMRVLKAEGEHLHEKEVYTFPRGFFEQIVATIVTPGLEEVRKAFIEEYAEQYDDIRYMMFQSVKVTIDALVKSDKEVPEGYFESVLDLLSPLDGVPESAGELEDFYVPQPKKKSHNLLSSLQHKKRAEEAWLAIMGLAVTKEHRKAVLDVMSTSIAPWFTKPELLADFLTDSYDAGGSMSLLALSGVFYLIQQRNLDYPSFYHKLYSLIDRDILHSKHRSRFFRLLDTFLASTHLPAALVASFVKRLSRLALNAPPSAIVIVVPWVYNLLKKHPLCTFMMHREIRDPEQKKKIQEHGFEDPFLPDEMDPMQTKALDSCVWELVQLQTHYHPNVATIAKIISEQFTKQSYNVEDFLDHSYASLLEAEMGKEVRKAPVVEFQIPKRVFLPQEAPAAVPDSLLVKFWDFEGSSLSAERA